MSKTKKVTEATAETPAKPNGIMLDAVPPVTPQAKFSGSFPDTKGKIQFMESFAWNNKKRNPSGDDCIVQFAVGGHPDVFMHFGGQIRAAAVKAGCEDKVLQQDPVMFLSGMKVELGKNKFEFV